MHLLVDAHFIMELSCTYPVFLFSQLLTDELYCYARKYALFLLQYSFYDNVTLLFFRRVWLRAYMLQSHAAPKISTESEVMLKEKERLDGKGSRICTRDPPPKTGTCQVGSLFGRLKSH